MLRWLTKRLTAWADDCQQREIDRLRAESQQLKAEIEKTTGEPFRLDPAELSRLAEDLKNVDVEELRRTSVLHPDDVEKLIEAIHSAENR